MAMKYIKLFESWRLMEAEGKQDSFDKSNPGGWPVLQTTIGDLRSGDTDKILTSVFRRSLQIGKEWDPKAGEGLTAMYYKKDAITNVSTNHVIGESMRTIKEIGYDENSDRITDDRDKIASFLLKYFQGFLEEGKKNDDIFAGPRVTKDRADKRFLNIKDKWMEFTKTKSYQELIKNADKIDKKIYQNIPLALDNIKKKLMENKEEDWVILISSDDNDKFAIELIVPNIEDSSSNPDDAFIADFKCKYVDGIKVNGEYVEEVPDQGDDLTLGMVMAWCNNINKTGNNKVALLSKTGAKNYQTDVASIFAGEDAEDLTQFAATIKVGGQNLALANGADGTKVPLFVSGTVQGICAFDFNKSTLQDSGKKTLESKALWGLLSKATKSIEITGHTDSVGKADYNKKLSEQRAQSVLEHLKSVPQFKQLKVQPTTSGKGSTEPIKDDNKGKDQNAAALNRRVVITIDGVPTDYAKLGIK
jgi:OOP family OmpA-OmpF porin